MAETFLRIDTAHLAPIEVTLDDVVGGNAGGYSVQSGSPGFSINPADLFLKFMKPKLTIKTPFGTIVKAPYGEPGDTSWPILAIVGIGAAIAAGVGLFFYFRRRKR